MKVIESANNPLIKQAKRINAGKAGDEPAIIVVEGRKLIDEALKSGARLNMCFIDSDSTIASQPELATKAMLVPRNILKELATVHTPGNIIAYFEPPAAPDSTEILEKSEMVVVLDRIQDPGNLGTIMRTSEALGVGAVILLKGCCSPFNPKTIRAAMGSSFRIPMLSMPDHQQALKQLKKHNFICLAASMQGTPLPAFPFPAKSALFFGQEGQGLHQEIFAECNHTLAIPMQGQVESLNVATSVALCLYEWVRGRSS
ncbi:MAG: hypothetical protein CVV42_18665 [Candidatus Riflebacteria bacterium HGW-Riflebacteria-2]|nr:MAG: hypothetical protein CVV42_18665 [Candidatus Riflebacteria bacterium HGW-Riflebacteria-2]